MADLEYTIESKYKAGGGKLAAQEQQELRNQIKLTNQAEADALQKSIDLLSKKISLTQIFVDAQKDVGNDKEAIDRQQKEVDTLVRLKDQYEILNVVLGDYYATTAAGKISTEGELEQTTRRISVIDSEIEKIKSLTLAEQERNAALFESLSIQKNALSQSASDYGAVASKASRDEQIEKQKELDAVLLTGRQKAAEAREKDADNLAKYNEKIQAEQQKIIDQALKANPGKTTQDAIDGSEAYVAKIKEVQAAEQELAAIQNKRAEIQRNGTIDSQQAAIRYAGAQKNITDAERERYSLEQVNKGFTFATPESLQAEADATRNVAKASRESREVANQLLEAEAAKEKQLIELLKQEESARAKIAWLRVAQNVENVGEAAAKAAGSGRSAIFAELRASLYGIRAAASGSAYGMSRVGSAMLTMAKNGGAAAAGVLGLVVVVAAATIKFIGLQKAMLDLNIGLAQNGKFTFDTSEQYKVIAQSLEQATGVAQSKWLPALAQLSKLNLNASQVTEYANAIRDLSKSNPSLNPEKLVEIIGGAAEGNFDQLEQLGIYIDDTKTHAEKLDLAFKQLADNGMASAELRSHTIAGAFQAAKSEVSRFFDDLGSFIFKSASAKEAMRNLEGSAGGLARAAKESQAGRKSLEADFGSLEKAYEILGKQIDTTSDTIIGSYQKEQNALKAKADFELSEIQKLIAARKDDLKSAYDTELSKININQTLSSAQKQEAKERLKLAFDSSSEGLDREGKQAELDRLTKERDFLLGKQKEAAVKAAPEQALKEFQKTYARGKGDLENFGLNNAGVDKNERGIASDSSLIESLSGQILDITHGVDDKFLHEGQRDIVNQLRAIISKVKGRLDVEHDLAKILSQYAASNTVSENANDKLTGFDRLHAGDIAKLTAAIRALDNKKIQDKNEDIEKERVINFDKQKEKTESNVANRQIQIYAFEGDKGLLNPRYSPDQILKLEFEIAQLKRQNEVEKGTIADPNKTSAQNEQAARLAVANANLEFEKTVKSLIEKTGNTESQDFKTRESAVQQNNPRLTAQEVTFEVRHQLAGESFNRGRIDLGQIVPGYKGFKQSEPKVNSQVDKTNAEQIDQLHKFIDNLDKRISGFENGQFGVKDDRGLTKEVYERQQRIYLDQLEKLEAPLKTSAKTLEMGANPGSIYVHDTHVEAILNALLGKPSSTVVAVGTGAIPAPTPSAGPSAAIPSVKTPVIPSPAPPIPVSTPVSTPDGHLTPEEIERRGGNTVTQQNKQNQVDAKRKKDSDATTAAGYAEWNKRHDAKVAEQTADDEDALADWDKKHTEEQNDEAGLSEWEKQHGKKVDDQTANETADQAQESIDAPRLKAQSEQDKKDYDNSQQSARARQNAEIDASQTDALKTPEQRSRDDFTNFESRMITPPTSGLQKMLDTLKQGHAAQESLHKAITTALSEQNKKIEQLASRIQTTDL